MNPDDNEGSACPCAGSYDPNQSHGDPAVQQLINEGWLGVWDEPISVADLENAVRIVRSADRNR